MDSRITTDRGIPIGLIEAATRKQNLMTLGVVVGLMLLPLLPGTSGQTAPWASY